MSRASLMSVPNPSGSNARSSRSIRRTCFRPFRGGTNSSTLSVKRSRPTLSLFVVAARDKTAASSTASSRLNLLLVPKSAERLTSTTSMTVNSRSSTYLLTWGSPVRAVTFQSIERTSSPGLYCRTSSNSIPRPLNTDRYSPEKPSWTSFRVVISMRRTLLMISSSSISGYLQIVEDALYDLLGGHVLSLGLECGDDAVP